MRHHIEHAKYKYDRITVTGWLVGDTPQSRTALWAEDAHGRRIPCHVERTERMDVAVAVFGAEAMATPESIAAPKASAGQEASAVSNALFGFRIRFDAGEGERYALCLSDGKKILRCKTDAAQIRRLHRIPDDFKEAVKIKLGGGEPPMVPARKSAGQGAASAGSRVKFSVVVPAYNTEPEHLADMIESIRQQTYENWELCIADGSPRSMLERWKTVMADATELTGVPSLTAKLAQTLVDYLTDPRVKYRHLSENLGISGNTNAALALAEGDFVVMVDHDDVLEEDALELVAQVVEAHPQADFIYTDSDLTDHDHLYHYNHLIKPRWSQEMLYSANYITHLSVVRTQLLRDLGGWKKEYDGAQDWDLFLRIGEATGEIYHIPEVLYHWRAAAGSTARDVGTKPYARLAQLRAVQDHLDRRGLPGQAAFVDEHSTCIRVVWDPQYLAAMDPDDVLIFTASGEKLSPESAAELRAWALQPGMGVIGPRVIGPEGRIVSQGITLEIAPNMPCFGMQPGTAGFGGHTDWYRDHVAPDPICWAISCSLWDQLGGLDESHGELALMDLCLRARKAGYRCMVTPFAQVYTQGAGQSLRQDHHKPCLTETYLPDHLPDHVKLYKTYYPTIGDRSN